MRYYKDEIKRYSEENEQVLSLLPENDEDFIEYDLTNEDLMTFASDDDFVKFTNEEGRLLELVHFNDLPQS